MLLQAVIVLNNNKFIQCIYIPSNLSSNLTGNGKGHTELSLKKLSSLKFKFDVVAHR